jgi:hypothetical protein
MPNDSKVIIPASIMPDQKANTCEVCRWSLSNLPRGYVCRRFPPVPTVFMMAAQPTRVGKMQPEVVTAFPDVARDSYCGEFQPRLSVIN